VTDLSKKKQFIGLLVWLGISFIAAAIGSAASIHAGAFYSQLIRADWAPPANVFGPVWTVLYVLMGISSWLVWRVAGFYSARGPLLIFIIQLMVNAIWSWLFFEWHQGALAFVDIVLLLALVIATIVSFWCVKPLAAALLIPYLLWISFAAVLNYSVWMLNPQMLG